eukprot:11811274-Alexandrium_andersonii.AAC.1
MPPTTSCQTYPVSLYIQVYLPGRFLVRFAAVTMAEFSARNASGALNAPAGTSGAALAAGA